MRDDALRQGPHRPLLFGGQSPAPIHLGRSYIGYQTLKLLLTPWVYIMNSPSAGGTQPGRFCKHVGVARPKRLSNLYVVALGASTYLGELLWGGALTGFCTMACHTPSSCSTLTVYTQHHHRASLLPVPTNPCAPSFPWDPFTSLDGFLSTSPTPPPLRSP